VESFIELGSQRERSGDDRTRIFSCGRKKKSGKGGGKRPLAVGLTMKKKANHRRKRAVPIVPGVARLSTNTGRERKPGRKKKKFAKWSHN